MSLLIRWRQLPGVSVHPRHTLRFVRRRIVRGRIRFRVIRVIPVGDRLMHLEASGVMTGLMRME